MRIFEIITREQLPIVCEQQAEDPRVHKLAEWITQLSVKDPYGNKNTLVLSDPYRLPGNLGDTPHLWPSIYLARSEHGAITDFFIVGQSMGACIYPVGVSKYKGGFTLGDPAHFIHINDDGNWFSTLGSKKLLLGETGHRQSQPESPDSLRRQWVRHVLSNVEIA